MSYTVLNVIRNVSESTIGLLSENTHKISAKYNQPFLENQHIIQSQFAYPCKCYILDMLGMIKCINIQMFISTLPVSFIHLSLHNVDHMHALIKF